LRSSQVIVSILFVTWSVILACSVGPLLDSGKSAPPPQVPPGQEVLFEVAHENFAWGYFHRGKYVNSEGEIWGFSYAPSDSAWRPADSDKPTLSELSDKYSHNPQLIGQIDGPTLQAMKARIGAASLGELTAWERRCADFGELRFWAYLSSDDTVYAAIPLRVAGDRSRRNLSDDATLLFEWLHQEIHGGGELPCDAD